MAPRYGKITLGWGAGTRLAWVIQKLDANPHAHKVVTIPTPKVTADTVLVEIRAVGLNFYDLLYAAGQYQYKPKLPFSIGSEYAGVIVQVGSAVAAAGTFKVGDRVFGTANPGTEYGGAACEYILAKPSTADPYAFMKCPEGLTMRECAAMRVTYLTSYHGLVDRGHIKKGEWVLVHAAAGGVGMAAVHIAKKFGCFVIATAGTDEKCQVCLDNGADVAINYNKDKEWGVTVKKLAQKHGREGVDVVYDVVGLVEASFKCTAYDARILLVGFTGRTPQNPERIRTNLVLVKGLNIISVTMGATLGRWPEKAPPIWEGLFDLFATTKFKPLVYKTRYRGLDTMSQALEELGARKTYAVELVGEPKFETDDDPSPDDDESTPDPPAPLPTTGTSAEMAVVETVVKEEWVKAVDLAKPVGTEESKTKVTDSEELSTTVVAFPPSPIRICSIKNRFIAGPIIVVTLEWSVEVAIRRAGCGLGGKFKTRTTG
ncbi:hypothetical protein HDU93_002991 [Gonapodya sp. JEL0774]|nr:hypothetical protein HDU93_002991 [Gonapodya sp. JEL0774]